ncbi:MAG: uroporphyrinogen decarboxylase family protein [Candidatus Helarchaeota archaeon]
MDARERVLTALNREQPDRVPLFELSIDNTHETLSSVYNLIPGLQRYMSNRFNNTLVRFLAKVIGKRVLHRTVRKFGMAAGKIANIELLKTARHFGIDGTIIMIGSLFATNWKLSSKFDYYVDEYGRMSAIAKNTLAWYKGGIMTPELLDEWGFPNPVDETRLAIYHHALEVNKDNKVLLMVAPGGLFETLIESVGLEKFFFYIYDNPSFIRRLFDLQTKFIIELSKYCLEQGTECIALGDDSCYKSGPMMSPKMFEKYLFPRYKKICNVIHKRGGKILLHSDGDTHMIIDGWIKSGVDAIHPFEPPMMKLKEAKEKWGDKICICGNVDCGITLVYGPKQRIIDEVKQCIKDAAEGGGYMLSSSNSIHYGVPIKNYQIMVDAGRKYGVYK